MRRKSNLDSFGSSNCLVRRKLLLAWTNAGAVGSKPAKVQRSPKALMQKELIGVSGSSISA